MPTLPDLRHNLAGRISGPVARIVSRTGLSPNTLTILGLLISIATAWVLATGHLFPGGFLVLLAGAFDLIDGAVARAAGKSTTFGALLDSTLDRLSEAVILFGLLVFFAARSLLQETLLIFATMVGSMLVSYIRARAESLGLRCEVGLFTRAERVIALALGLVLSPIHPLILIIALWILAVFTHITAAQRLVYTWWQTKKG